jgi:hypothetical protein
MDHAKVRIILETVISSPVKVNLAEFDESIQWVGDRGTTRQLDRGAHRNGHSSQIETAAVEMRVLRRVLARGWSAGTEESANVC